MNIDFTSHYYRVAEHLFVLQLEQGIIPDTSLSAYEPFREQRETDASEPSPLFTLTATTAGNHFPEISNSILSFDTENGTTELFHTRDGGLLFCFSLPDRAVCCRLYTDSTYHHATAYLHGEAFERLYGLTNSLMLLYTFATAPLNTLLMHASVIENEGYGYVFLGKSGTGKSTHSRLWLEHITGSSLLNDDNPVVRIIDGCAKVYGSPWSGKTPCYRNESAPVGGIVRIKRALKNKIRRLSPIESYASLLTSSSGMTWDKELADGKDRTLQQMIAAVPCWTLECLPDEEAAQVCAQAVRKEGQPCNG